MNYHLYRDGVDSDDKTCGRKKSEIWNELSALTKEKGIVMKSIPHQVGIKICKMEGEYKKTNDWLCGTRQGVLEQDGDIQDKIKNMFPYFYQIHPIRKNRPAVNLLAVAELCILNDENNNLSNSDVADDEDYQPNKKPSLRNKRLKIKLNFQKSKKSSNSRSYEKTVIEP
jgi:hypothetical protein